MQSVLPANFILILWLTYGGMSSLYKGFLLKMLDILCNHALTRDL